MSQNTSTAVMARRIEPPDSLDFFPTPSWATRAFIEHVFVAALGHHPFRYSVWEPAAGQRHMARPLAEVFDAVHASDIADYGAGVQLFDFLSLGDTLGRPDPPFGAPDWIITNPPFKDYEKWVVLALEVATVGVAMFGRIQILESIGRFDKIWKPHRDHALAAIHSERVPLMKGRVDPDGQSATAYGWLIIDKTQTFANPFPSTVTIPTVLIPPCRKAMERDGDYDAVDA